MRSIHALMLFFWIVCQATTAWADYREDIGHDQLAVELGGTLPDGSGMMVTQIEAPVNNHWMPDTTHAEFSGQSIVDQTGGDTGSSTHATMVGRYYYGSASSMAPGIGAVDVYDANDWLGAGFLGTGYLYNGRPFQPVYDRGQWPWLLASPARVANHSWVGASGSQGHNILRRLDFVVAQDDHIQITAVNNGTEASPLLSNAYNSISVGRTDGGHPTGTSTIDTLYVEDRVSPLLVVPNNLTSYCAPMTAATAAMLMEVGQDPALSDDPVTSTTADRSGNLIYNAQRAEVIKAVLMAGANRVTDNTSIVEQISDYRQDSNNGLDHRYGAGQLDVYASYHILNAGEQNSAEDEPASGGAIGANGFDVDPAFGGSGGSNTVATYTFTAGIDQRRIYAALVWHLRIDGGQWNDFDDTAIRYDLNLSLSDVTASGYRRLVAQSNGAVDNTENLWATLVPGRDYEIKVTAADGQSPFSWDYALAWRMETPQDRDGDGIPDDWEVQHELDHTLASDAGLDGDSDQLSHLEEYENGTDPDTADSDGDGQTDGFEVNSGSDPLNPNDTAIIPIVTAMGRLTLAMTILLTGISGWVVRQS